MSSPVSAPASGRPGGRLIDRDELRRLTRPRTPMGNQPALDGIRAVSVALVVLYHAGLSGVHGGFLGVEVFFVVSGYLITTLLLDEQHREGRVDLRAFWVRRARRLLPALFVMIGAVTAWSLVAAPEHVGQLRRDLLPALAYVGNWGQVFGSVPYFSTADPLLRHVWSLAVEEQWYLLWPLAFAALVRLVRGRRRVAGIGLASAAFVIAVISAVVASGGDEPIELLGQSVDRFNLLYLNTVTRSSGLLLGAALAFVWRPWDRAAASESSGPRALDRVVDAAGPLAVGGIVAIAVTRGAGVLTGAGLYRGWLPAVSLLSAIGVAAVVSPRSTVSRRVFGWGPLVAVGRRSYGIYLWHWPVFVLMGVRDHHERLAAGLVATAVVSEACYRYVETPVRSGALGRWWRGLAAVGPARVRLGGSLATAGALAVVAGLAVPVLAFDEPDPAVDDAEVAFDPLSLTVPATPPPTTAPPTAAPAVTEPPAEARPASTRPSTTLPATTIPATTTTLATLPRSIVVVGDSQAHSLAVNLPSGIGDTFRITDGSVSGCGVWATGTVLTARTGFHRSLADCAGWEGRWGRAAERSGAELALVVIGAWDLFDLRVGEVTVGFDTPDGDALFLANLQRGIDALQAAGSHVALLEVACMRPQDVRGAGVPALPERGDDTRVAHLNDLLRHAAAADPSGVTFVEGPDAWCDDPVTAADLDYRWDGVHVYKQGAKLIFETIGAALLSIPL